MNIRRGNKNDLESILSIAKRCFDHPWSRILFEADLDINPNAMYWVACDEDDPSGLLGFIGVHNIAGEVSINNIAVAPEAQGRGIASALMDALIGCFEDKDIIGITLEVRVGNEPAVALYEKYGFIEEGRRKAYYKSGEDAIIMWRRK